MKNGSSSLLFVACLCVGGTGVLFSQDRSQERVVRIPGFVVEKCSLCHAPPPPFAMPRYAWAPTIQTMKGLMGEAKLPITDERIQRISDYYVKNSPEKLAAIPDDYEQSPLKFYKMPVGNLPQQDRPQITSAKFTDLDGDGNKDDIIVTDNNSGEVSWVRKKGLIWLESKLANVPAPVNTTALDIDGDGDMDLAVSAMGYMHPNERLIGELHILLNQGEGKFEQHVVVSGAPRITDSAAADFDGDGDIDFVLAMFGWRKTGGIGFLEQVEPMKFKLHLLQTVNGGMRVIVNDANKDGKPDFVALITQQHEAILQFVNDGGGKFTSHFLSRANYPSFGSSSIELVDLDQDGDEDILYTNGDMMDDFPLPKPYHGVRWLENDGKGKYKLNYLAGMPGCYCAKSADMDGDGDLDVVFSALYFQWKERDFPSLAWLENLSGDFKKFVPRKIAYAPTNLANINIGDANNDGKLDIIGTGMHVPGPLDRRARLTLWLGRGKEKKAEAFQLKK